MIQKLLHQTQRPAILINNNNKNNKLCQLKYNEIVPRAIQVLYYTSFFRVTQIIFISQYFSVTNSNI